MPFPSRFNHHRSGRLFAYLDLTNAGSGMRGAMADPFRSSKLILIDTLLLTMGFVVSYSYPGSDNGSASVKFPLPVTGVVLPILLLVTPCGTIFAKFTSWPLIVKSWLNGKSS